MNEPNDIPENPEVATSVAENAKQEIIPDSNESTLVKAAKGLQKAISMARIGTDRCKLGLLMRALNICDDIISWESAKYEPRVFREEKIREANRPAYPLDMSR